MDNKMYYIQKEAVYYHGIYWIGDDVQEGRRLLEKFALEDEDAHHTWVLYRYFENDQDAKVCEAKKSDFSGVEYVGEDTERNLFLYKIITPFGDELNVGVPRLRGGFIKEKEHVYGLNLTGNKGHTFANGKTGWFSS